MASYLDTLLLVSENITGVYELIPYYKGENTVFDVSPPSMSVSVEHDHATVLPKFQV